MFRFLTLFSLVTAATASAAKLPTLDVGPKAKFHNVQAAIDAAPKDGAVLKIAPGAYREKIQVHTPNIHLVGIGKSPKDVVLSWN